MRRINDYGLELIKCFEKFSPVPYLCPASIETIGFGHRIIGKEKNKFKNGITEAEALALLQEDVRKAEAAVSLLIRVPLNDNQFSAVTSFTYNVGGAALQRSTLRAKINRGEHEDVPQELAKWIWADGRRLRGLMLRREAEARLYCS